MIRTYKNSALASFFEYNHPDIEAWADNVFEKIRQVGELAVYVKRNKENRVKYNVFDPAESVSVLVDQNEFTFGRAYNGPLLTITDSRTDNLGVVWEFEFEVMFNEESFETITFLDQYIVIDNVPSITVLNITVTGFSFTLGELYKIKVVRNHLNITFYVNGVEVGSGILNDDSDTTYEILYQVGSGEFRTYDESDYDSDIYS